LGNIDLAGKLERDWSNAPVRFGSSRSEPLRNKKKPVPLYFVYFIFSFRFVSAATEKEVASSFSSVVVGFVVRSDPKMQITRSVSTLENP